MSPARSISLWLTIWASDGLSFRTGRKARENRKFQALSKWRFAAAALGWRPASGKSNALPFDIVSVLTQPLWKTYAGTIRGVTTGVERD
jgi:hypothetical protein